MQAPITQDMMNDQQQDTQQYAQQAQPQVQPQVQPTQDDEVQMAKQALGLDIYEQQLEAMKSQLEQSRENAIFKEVSSQFEDVPPEEVEKEIKEMSEKNPQMANVIKSDKDGLEMLFKKVQSEMKPKEKPDEITDSGDAGGEVDDLSKKIKDGTASEIDLGDFILKNS